MTSWLWLLFALMTMTAIFAVLWPLGHAGRTQSGGSEAAVYKDQLAEIERDLASGVIAAPEAEAARVEISRRLLAATGAERKEVGQSRLGWRRAVALVALIGLPVVAVAVYIPLGSPKLPDFPLAQRAPSPEALTAQVEQHLEKNPTDGRAWSALGPLLKRLGRYDDAVRAYRNSLTYNGENAERRSDLGQALTVAAGGVVTAEAKAEFERAHTLNADDPKANYFLGLAATQAMVAQVEQHLEKNPTDGRGWSVLAPVLERLGRYDDAVRAYRNSLTYNGENAERRSDLGEILTVIAGGVVTAEAKAEFERAYALSADDPRANYFLGLAAKQDGRKDDAATIWRTLLNKAPADAPWRPEVESLLAQVTGDSAGAAIPRTTLPPAQVADGSAAPALSDDTIAAAKNMNEGDRSAMIRGMVERLASRLKQNGNDVDGWLHLVRAYVVMGERDKAKSAIVDARAAVANDAERLRLLNEGLKNLGLDG